MLPTRSIANCDNIRHQWECLVTTSCIVRDSIPISVADCSVWHCSTEILMIRVRKLLEKLLGHEFLKRKLVYCACDSFIKTYRLLWADFPLGCTLRFTFTQTVSSSSFLYFSVFDPFHRLSWLSVSFSAPVKVFIDSPITPVALDWFRSSLSDRTQSFIYSGQQTESYVIL